MKSLLDESDETSDRRYHHLGSNTGHRRRAQSEMLSLQSSGNSRRSPVPAMQRSPLRFSTDNLAALEFGSTKVDPDRPIANLLDAVTAAPQTASWGEVMGASFSDKKNYVLWLLAFASGWADVLCVIRYFAYATMMTGNSIYTAQSVAKGCWHDVGVYIALIVSYAAGMTTFRIIDATMHRCCPGGRIGPATILAPIVVSLFVAADLTFYAGDNKGDDKFECGKNVSHGVWGILLVAHAMGAVNGLSMRIDKITTNAVTGHILTSSSLAFDQVSACISGVQLETQDKYQMVLSLGIIICLLSGIATGTSIQQALDLDSSRYFHPAFTILGAVYGVLLWLHDHLLMSDDKWQPRVELPEGNDLNMD